MTALQIDYLTKDLLLHMEGYVVGFKD